ncbi:MAG: VOC family protein [Thermoplasmata archaeon]|nr:VOC family protein [Thermoplasmata archaeon]
MRPVDYVMVLVSDMDRSVDFYENKLGLKLVSRSPGWTEFDSGTTRFALHAGGTPNPSGRDPGSGERRAGQCSIGFNVTDLDATYRELRQKGVPFVLPPQDRGGTGIRLAVAEDPDGLSLSFTQRVPRGAT